MIQIEKQWLEQRQRLAFRIQVRIILPCWATWMLSNISKVLIVITKKARLAWIQTAPLVAARPKFHSLIMVEVLL